jgi:hypothetical protein
MTPERMPHLSPEDAERAARRARTARNKAFLLKVLLAIVAMAALWAWISWRLLRQRYPLPPGIISTSPEPSSQVAPPAASPAASLKLHVTPLEDALEVGNDTDVTWDQCQVEISGGYRADLSILPAKFTDRILFTEFTRDGQTLPAADAFARSKQRVEISCIGPDSKRQTATF